MVAAAVAIALTLAGFTSVPASSTTDSYPTPGLLDSPAPKAIHDWLGYDRPAQYDSIDSEVRVPVRDGTRLDCYLYRPGHDGEVDSGRHPSRQVVTTDKLHDVQVPALHIGGYFDIFKNGGFDALKQRPRQTWLLNGPWIHGGFLQVPGVDPALQGVDPTNAISLSVVLEWFDHWLAKLPGAQLPPDRVISYASTSAKASGSWHGYDHWPSAATSGTRLYPTSDGSLAGTAPAPTGHRYQINPIDGPSAAVTGTLPYDPGQNQAAAEQNSELPGGRYVSDRATFTLLAFTSDTTLAGPVTLHLNASIDTKDTYFVSKLETVLPDGRVLPIETGYLRAQLRNSLERAEPVTPGAPTQYTVQLGQTHWEFKPGEELRITIGGGDFPRIVPDNPLGDVTVQLGSRTYVELPVVK